jgi:lysyl-tRNA synthetase class 2
LLAPSLHQIPEEVTDSQTLATFPQLELVLSDRKKRILKCRHIIESTIQKTFDDLGFTKVSTPVIAADTGGANARPFETTANEFPKHILNLRIAQELDLKKLVAANIGPVYEIGPVFRNEGIDATHNPEFTTCEFYEPYATLAELMKRTESLIRALHSATGQASGMPQMNSNTWTVDQPFAVLPFIPTLLGEMRRHISGFRLPSVLDENAAEELKVVFLKLSIPFSEDITISNLLDALAARFIEPLCGKPTFLTDFPAIMSPLAKSFICPDTGHEISARAELFINETEYANMYEEENSPFEQTRKFLAQAGQSKDGSPLDLSRPYEELFQLLTPGQRYYVRVLEMGMPPTGGWGCGIDRLTMLFGGAERISDVLPFGTLRSVVAMGSQSSKA